MVYAVKVVNIVGSLHCTVYDAGASVADSSLGSSGNLRVSLDLDSEKFQS